MFGYQGYDIVGESLSMCEEKFNKDKYQDKYHSLTYILLFIVHDFKIAMKLALAKTADLINDSTWSLDKWT